MKCGYNCRSSSWPVSLDMGFAADSQPSPVVHGTRIPIVSIRSLRVPLYFLVNFVSIQKIIKRKKAKKFLELKNLNYVKF